MKLIRWSLSTLMLAAASLGVTATGCDKKTSPERDGVQPGSAARGRGNVGPTDSAAVSENRSAVESIAAARCEREQRCNNIGNGKKYDSRGSCVTSVRSDWQGELSSLECPRGIEPNKLDACLDRLRTDGCANPVETLGRVAACRQAELCKAS